MFSQICCGTLNNRILQIHNILSPLAPLAPSNFVAYVFLSILSPFLVEGVLLLRLAAVYPTSINSTKTLFKIYTFPVLIKTTRLVTIALFMSKWISLTRSVGSPVIAGEVLWNASKFTLPYGRVDFGAD